MVEFVLVSTAQILRLCMLLCVEWNSYYGAESHPRRIVSLKLCGSACDVE